MIGAVARACSLVAVCVSSMVLMSCGDDPSSMPPTAVATVGDQAIPRAELRAAMKFLAPLAAGQQQGQQQEASAKARRDALRTLIRQRWIWRAADERGIELEPGAVDRVLATPQEAPQGNIGSPVFWRNVLRTELLRKRLVRQAMAEQDVLSPAALRRYFHAHREELAFPERRDMMIVAFETRREAAAARRRLAAGESWRAVWRHSLHDVAGGTQPVYALVEGEAEPPLDDAVFGARIGALSAPIETSAGWYVFKLTSVTASSPATFGASRDGIETALKARFDRRFEEQLRRDYRAHTRCRANVALPICAGS